jgi:hypothetical protein
VLVRRSCSSQTHFRIYLATRRKVRAVPMVLPTRSYKRFQVRTQSTIRPVLPKVTSAASRGSKSLDTLKPRLAQKGEWIRLVESDPSKEAPNTGSLDETHLYGDLMPSGSDLLGTSFRRSISFPVKRTSGKTIELERPLPIRYSRRVVT